MEVCTGKKPFWFGILFSHSYTIAALGLYAGLFIPFMTLLRDWETCILVEARRMWAGETIYGHDDLYPYPPLPALLAVPFAQLPVTAGQVAFYSLNMACLCLMVHWSWLLTGGGRLQGSSRVPATEHLIMLLGLLSGFSYALNCLSHHQLDLLIGTAMIGGCQALSRGRSYLAAACFGLAAAFKGPALLWAPYLVWRGKWREACCVLGFFVGLNLLPSLVVPAQWQRFETDGVLLVEWSGRFLKPMGESSEYPFFWYTESNQSLMGSSYRWLCTTWCWRDAAFWQRLPVTAPASPGQLKAFFLTCAGLLLAWTMFAQGLNRPKATVLPKNRASSNGTNRLPGPLALECGMVLMLMLLLSPMTGKAHCGTMLVPGLALARLAVYSGRGTLRIFLAAALLAVLFSQNFMGEYVVCVGMWYGAVTWAALLLWAGCGLALRDEDRQ